MVESNRSGCALNVLKKILLLGLLMVSQLAFAACLTAETEPNNTDTAASVGLCAGTNVTGVISASSDYDWYKLDVTGAGTISINLSHGSGVDFDWYLYAATGSYIAYASTSNNPETGSKAVTAAGIYYVRVKSYAGTAEYPLNVYRVPGTITGTNTFSMTTFTGTGGTTQSWSVDRGTLTIR